MRRWTRAAAVALLFGLATLAGAQTPAAKPDDAKLPKPGTRGNPDNVPYIGGKDPQGNPVRLAKATGHVSNYSEDKVPPYTLPDPLTMASGERVSTAQMWRERRRLVIPNFCKTDIYGRIAENAPKVGWQVIETGATAR